MHIAHVVNAVLVKLLPVPYQSKYNSLVIMVDRDTSSSAINAKPMGTISAINVNRDTSSQQSIQNQWARSQLSMSTETQAHAINAKLMGMISANNILFRDSMYCVSMFISLFCSNIVFILSIFFTVFNSFHNFSISFMSGTPFILVLWCLVLRSFWYSGV